MPTKGHMHVFFTLNRRYRQYRLIWRFSCVLLLGLTVSQRVTGDRIPNPQDATAIRTIPDAPDPSTSPATNEAGLTIERYRFVVDLDQDGDDDLLLSDGPESFGTAGGYFWCFLNENDTYHHIGGIDGHPRAVALEQLDNRTRIWVYLHGSATSGVVGYYEIRDGRLSELQYIEINPDPFSENLGSRIYKSIFQPPNLLTAEISTTVGNDVTWKPLPH